MTDLLELRQVLQLHRMQIDELKEENSKLKNDLENFKEFVRNAFATHDMMFLED